MENLENPSSQTPENLPVGQPVVSQEAPQKPRLKVILLSLLGLILVGGAVYGAFSIGKKQTIQPSLPKQEEVAKPSPTPDETANWKTYTNGKYGFEFKYPDKLSFDSMGGSALLGFKLAGPSMVLTFSMYDMDVASLYDWVTKHGSNTAISFFPAQEVHSSKRGGYETVEWKEFYPEENTEEKSVSFSQNNQAYVIKLYRPTDDSLNIFDQILSTFKFLPAESLTDETVDWEVYSNRQYKFSFRYPSDFSQNTKVQGNFFWVNLNENKADSLIIEAKTEYLPGEVNYFLDTEATGQKDINGNIWKTYSLPQGYCDGPSCTSPIFALQIEKNKVLYSVTINNQNKMTELQEKILSTFKFLE